MRTFIAVALSTTLLASAAFAADNLSPLAPGKPAGVKQAQIGQTGWVLIGVGAVAAIAIGVAVIVAIRPRRLFGGVRQGMAAWRIAQTLLPLVGPVIAGLAASRLNRSRNP